MGIIEEAEQKLKSLAGHVLKPVRAGAGGLATEKERPDTLKVTTPAFQNGAPIPTRHAAEQNVSPALSWSGVPEGAQEFAVMVEDPDAPAAQPFVHWSIYGIPPSVTSLPEGVGSVTTPPAGAVEGKSSRGQRGFFGPKPPAGHGTHHYHFQVFALDAPLGLGPGADRDAILQAMRGHVIAQGDVMGTYENR